MGQRASLGGGHATKHSRRMGVGARHRQIGASNACGQLAEERGLAPAPASEHQRRSMPSPREHPFEPIQGRVRGWRCVWRAGGGWRCWQVEVGYVLSLQPVGPGGEALAEPALERRSAAPGQVKNEQASGAKGAG